MSKGWAVQGKLRQIPCDANFLSVWVSQLLWTTLSSPARCHESWCSLERSSHSRGPMHTHHLSWVEFMLR